MAMVLFSLLNSPYRKGMKDVKKAASPAKDAAAGVL
jgi:hypothetical protein